MNSTTTTNNTASSALTNANLIFPGKNKPLGQGDGVTERSVGRDHSREEQSLQMKLTHITEIANKMHHKSDTELEKCYGRQCLHCKEECNLKPAGQNVIREKQEVLSIHNGTNHRVYIDAVAHREDLSGMAENLRRSKSGGDCQLQAEMYADLFKALENPQRNENSPIALIPSAPSAEAMRFAADALRRLFWLLEKKPETTMVLLHKVFLGESQADQARKRNVSRQAVNKQVRGDLAGIAELLGLRVPVANKEARLLQLTPEEFGVYKVCYVDGCSVRSAAIQLDMSPTKVHRLKQKVSQKLTSETRKKRVRKK